MKINEILNYQEACEELNDQPVKSTKSRNLQLKRWNKLVEIEKIGKGKYIIKRVLTDEEIQFYRDKDNYSQYLQNMLLKLFANQEELKHTYTYRDLRENLDMVNQHYFPVKYGKEDITLNTSVTINLNSFRAEADNIVCFDEERWFELADSHDKDAIKYAINKLNEKGLVTSMATYVFYKIKRVNKDTTIVTHFIATTEEKSELDQIPLDMVAKYGKKNFSEVYKNPRLYREYDTLVQRFLKERGYDRYARAFTVQRPSRLKDVAEYFAPKFNSMQVIRYLNTTKKFEEIDRGLHEQLTNQLIKI